MAVISLSGSIFALKDDPSVTNDAVNVSEGLKMISEGLSVDSITIPKDINPSQSMSKQMFAHHLFEAIQTTGEYHYIQIYLLIEDAKLIHTNYMNSIQGLLISKIVDLDENQKFHPKQPMTKKLANDMIQKAIQFIEEHQGNHHPGYDDDSVSSVVEKVNEDINKVTVSWGEQPHPGYGISIAQIVFDQDVAIVYYQPHYPDPDMMYPQVIVYPKASTYVDSKYQVEIKGFGDKSTSSVEPSEPIKRAKSIAKIKKPNNQVEE